MLENDLTNIEMLIMKCIWDTPEELALSQLVAMVNERFEKSWKPQTISTYLAHLVRKGYLSMRRKGKVFLYHPEVSEESYRSSQIDELVNYWGDPGTPTEFLSALFLTGDSESESYEYLEDLRKLSISRSRLRFNMVTACSAPPAAYAALALRNFSFSPSPAMFR